MFLEIKKSHSPTINSKNTTFSQIKFINRENNKYPENNITNTNITNSLNHKVISPNSGLMHNTNFFPKNFTNGNSKVLNPNNTNYNLNSKGNNFNLHQRYKSSNSEMLIENLNKININAFNKNNLNPINNNTITEEENAKIFFNNISEKNIQKFSPAVSKEFQLNIKTNYNISSNAPNQFSGNFTTNNFYFMNGNKNSKCIYIDSFQKSYNF